MASNKSSSVLRSSKARLARFPSMLSAPSARADRAFGSTRCLKVVRREPMFSRGLLVSHAVQARKFSAGDWRFARNFGSCSCFRAGFRRRSETKKMQSGRTCRLAKFRMAMTNQHKSIVPGTLDVYPVLPLRDIVVFPHMIVPLFVGREKSIRALEEVMKNDALIMLATQKNASDDDPTPDSIYETGTLASVLQLLKLPDGTVKVLVEGLERARVEKYTERSEYYEATAVALADTDATSVEAEALARSVVSDFESYVKLNKKISAEVVGVVQAITDFAKLGDQVASHLAVKIADRQAILETLSVTARLEKVLGLMESEISVLQVEKRIRSRVKRQMEKTQREYYLNEQMKAIQKELGDDEGRDELADLEEKINKTKLSKEAREKAQHELKKLRQMSPMSAEDTVVRNYLDWLLSIPWNKKSKVKKDLVAAQEVLDSDHYGLEKVKDRIVEYLAVQSRANKLTGPILCLVGPPGVGKTSLGKSIAKATGREFVRVSLGGVRDEAEIRGHRRTYIGSMPGKII